MDNLPPGLTFNRVKIIFIIIGAILAIILAIYFGLRMVQHAPAIQLTVWGVFDNKKAFDALVKNYKKENSSVTITYVQKTYDLNETENYEKDLINALAEGKGPDIFMVQNNWLPKHQSKIKPLDPRLQTAIGFPYVNYLDKFPGVVVDDFTRDTTIYAAPLYLDSLAMFYNRDFFDRKGIALVPSTWTEFERTVPQLREIDPSTNEIKRAAAAIGGSNASINRSTDLLTAVMMQNGAEFTDKKVTHATFAQGLGDGNPGIKGLKFYAQFANSLSPFFTWSERFPYSIDSFSSGDTAIMFNYAHVMPLVKSKNPFLDFRVAPLPQPAGITQPVNYANYWGFSVSKQSKNAQWAWDFIISITANEASEGAYLELTGKPPALRALIDKKFNDPTLGVFARQALTAKSWRQKDDFEIERILSEMISDVISGKLSAESSILKAEDKVSLLMR